jgi:hypothetical protein
LFSPLKYIYQIKFTFQHFSKNTKILKWTDRKFSFRSILIRTYPTTLIHNITQENRNSTPYTHKCSKPRFKRGKQGGIPHLLTVNHAWEDRNRQGLRFDISFARFGQGTKKLRPRNGGGKKSCGNEREKREKVLIFLIKSGMNLYL